MNIEALFYSQLATIITFIVALFVLYRVLVSQKDATIELLKEKNDFISHKLAEASSQSPDMLAKSLADRVKLLDEEIERLSNDKEKNQDIIKEKEEEISKVRSQAKILLDQISIANELIEDFTCPTCGSHLVERAFQTEMAEDYQGRTVDIDHEYILYDCGLTIVDGIEERPCQKA